VGRPRVAEPGVRLAPFDRAYLGIVRDWIADPALRDLVGTATLPSEEEHERWHERITRDPTRHTSIILEDGEPRGLIGLLAIDRNYRKAELWLYVGRAVDRRQGVGAAALRQMLSYAFGTLELHRVYVHVFGFNEAAHAFFGAAGFRDEGTELDAVFKHGTFHDVWLMSMLAPEFNDL
jgi:RimJ/RimL family protein N-acetyltransferase